MSRKKTLLLFVMLVVLSVSTVGCVSKSKYDTLMQDYETSQTNLTSAQREYDFLQSEMASLQKEWEEAKAVLEAEIAEKSTDISEAQSTIEALSQDIAALQAKLDEALNTEIKQAFTFSFQTKDFTWELSIPLKTFLYYKGMARITDTSKYAMMVKDNYANSLLDKFILQVEDAVLRYSYDKTEAVDLIGAFIQSLVFANNDVTTPYDNYPRYPIETLFDQTADSEDTSILAAALLYRLDYNVVFFVFGEPKHVGLGIYVPAVMGLDGWEYQAKRYIYLETTGDTWTLGHAPVEYATRQPQVYPVGE